MNCLTGETKWPEFIKEHFEDIRQPFTAGIEIWPECNFRCIHCYAESDRRNQSNSMSKDEILKIIDILIEHNCIEIFFTGGECLLHKDFFEIYRYAKECGLLVSVLTNGALINEQHIELWREFPPELISVTMYGASAETYKRITGNENGYKQFCSGIELLHKNKIPFEIKCIGMKQNLNDILKIREFARKYGLKNAILAWDIRPMNDGNKEPVSYRVSAEEAFHIEMQDIERKNFWRQLAFDQNKESRTIRQKEGKLFLCAIAQQFVFITHDGYMQGCVKAIEPRYHLLKGNFDDGWKFLGQEFVDKKASDSFKCLDCNKFRYCAQCTAAFQDENGVPEMPVDFYCQLGELRKRYMDEVVNEK